MGVKGFGEMGCLFLDALYLGFRLFSLILGLSQACDPLNGFRTLRVR